MRRDTMQIRQRLWLYNLLVEGRGKTKQLHLTKNRGSVTRAARLEGDVESLRKNQREIGIKVKAGVTKFSVVWPLRVTQIKMVMFKCVVVFHIMLAKWSLASLGKAWPGGGHVAKAKKSSAMCCGSCTWSNLITFTIWCLVLGSLCRASTGTHAGIWKRSPVWPNVTYFLCVFILTCHFLFPSLQSDGVNLNTCWEPGCGRWAGYRKCLCWFFYLTDLRKLEINRFFTESKK